MLSFLWLIPAFPLAGFVILTLTGARLPRSLVNIVGVGSIGVAAIITFSVGAAYLLYPPAGDHFVQTLWMWFTVDGLRATINLYLDALSLVMILVVTYVGFLIHYYSTDFMSEDEGYSRFFAYMNLFVASMLVLVLADNLLMLLLGWEGVGLCSYLLIGFWYKDPDNGKAAIKAFLVTRVGDVAFLIGIFILFIHTGTLNIQQAMARAAEQWQPGAAMAVAAAWLILIGAMGKSAQVPLQVWLPDAMAGPTPVSALIHAATMVAAGVYLIARLNGVFMLAPSVRMIVAIIGVVTILLAGISALAQDELKKVLAYSTISQLGYMFLALGVGAWSAAIFHFLSHAFFKSLLFLCAGVIILALHHEVSMLRMGGLRKKLPIVYLTFLVGALTTAGLPPTAGFASKDFILYRVWALPHGGPLLWAGALVGVFFTSLYSFRMVFLTFFGETKTEPSRSEGFVMGATLVVLAAFCFLVGALDWPETLGGTPFFSRFLETALPPPPPYSGSISEEVLLELISVGVGLFGLFVTWLLFVARPNYLSRIVASRPGVLLHRLWYNGWGFDWLYAKVFVQPFVFLSRKNRKDFIDRFYDGIAQLMENLHGLLSLTQNGNLRWYAMTILIGAIVLMAVIIFA